MPTSATGAASARAVRASRTRGFTLIELLVVLAILGVMLTVAALAVRSLGGERQLQRESDRLRALLELACERTQMTGQSYGLLLARDQYGFARFDGNAWALVADAELRVRRLPEAMHLQARDPGPGLAIEEQLPDEPQVVCDPGGEMVPFSVLLALPAARIAYELKGSWDTRIETRVHHED